MARYLALSAALLAALSGCDAPPAADGPGAKATAATDQSTIPQIVIAPDGTERIRRIPGVTDYIRYPDDPMLPAYRTTQELLAAKADSYDDQRYAAPERYAITIPPNKTVRPMVEWEPMQAIMMGVPSYVMTASYVNTRNTVLQIAKNAATVAQVWFVVPSSSVASSLQSALLSAGMSQQSITSQVRFMVQPIDSIWFIDYGPLPIIDTVTGTWSFADFRYYHQRPLDDGIPSWISRNLTSLGLPGDTETYRMPVSIEGGTFQSTTDGVCFTGSRALTYTGDCAASGCTNNLEFLPLSQIQTTGEAKLLEQTWGKYAGCKDLVVTYSITDDGTGHIDMYLKVLDDNTVLVGEYREPFANTAEQTNAARMDANAAFLQAYVKPDGSKFTVKRIIMPGHRENTPFTYVNSTLINGLNLWPAFTYSDWVSSRNTAEAEWEAALPEYTHVWIDSEELSFASGAIHCITRTIPASAAAKWIGDGTCSGASCVPPLGGYDGVCGPNGVTTPVCYGPQWLCGCNDCNSGCTGGGTSACGSVTVQGCCTGGTLSYCDNNALGGQVCLDGCGWDASKSWYDCGFTGSDPAGVYPRACQGECVPDCSGSIFGGVKECGSDGCGGSCGTCPANETCSSGTCVSTSDACGGITYEGCCDGDTLRWCENGLNAQPCAAGQCGWEAGGPFYNCNTAGGADPSGANPKSCSELVCTPSCTGKVCGSDGCGGSCGNCGASTVCNAAGQCVAACTPKCSGKQCGPDGCGGSCGTCAVGSTCSASGSCQAGCTPACTGKTCGPDGCGGSCGTCAVGESCSSGSCVGGCTPSCTGKVCGPDGCGGTCGTCGVGQTCSAAGQCEAACAPLCTGMACGSDGCGGSCGTCAVGQVCNASGQCEGPCAPSCSGKACGPDGCGGSCGTCAVGQSCTATGQCVEGCAPSCSGKACGPDGCGGSCGTCALGETCTAAGKCIETCAPACAGKVCGDDGCGGTCGTCGAGESCTGAGQCVTGCAPDCVGKSCGDDGCGGSCGSCAASESCEAGQCVGTCAPDCEGKNCGDDGCGGSCGSCAASESCDAGQCVPKVCVPACADKACGLDGCGGSCGACGAGQACDGGQCADVEGCGDVTAEGSCEGSVVTWCEDGALKSFDCKDQGRICGLKEGVGSTCIDACVPDCAGKQCGDDGCGGQCGTCPLGQACGGGVCSDVAGPDATPDSEADAGDAGDTGDTADAPDASSGGDAELGDGAPDASGGDAEVGNGAVEGGGSPGGTGPSGCAGGGGAGGPLGTLAALLLLLVALRRRRARLS
ncbi:MAG: agmatine deiminase family protein [Deltaproteobacteria bacterium]|nr:agmatine deiminase family protein [Deltaproteobacteria bacterium]